MSREPGLREIDDRPGTRRAWLASVWRHRGVLLTLAQADFHVRYKRAVFGVAWAVAVPLAQAFVLAVVFSRLVNITINEGFAAYILAGVLAWNYFSQTVMAASTAIVDGSGLTDKVWFPRALLPLVPCLANLVGMGVSLLALVVALPFIGSSIDTRVLWLIPAAVLLFCFTASMALVLSALHVYFRDVKFLVQTGMLMWFYVTPIAYPRSLLRGLEHWADLNPATGIVTMFQVAAVGPQPHWGRAVAVSVALTVVMAAAALEAHRRHDRLFVDLL
jgi:ABC-type polysaccharide/polyol phosphate export permease